MSIDPARSADTSAAGVLFAWFSAAFPTGGFAYSQGLETMVAQGQITNAEALHDWLADVLAHGAGWTDAVLLSLAYRAVQEGDTPGLFSIAELAQALAPSRERAQETMGQGEAFLAAVRAGWPRVLPARMPARTAHPVAAGAAGAGLGAPVSLLASGYLTAMTSSLIAASVRLSVCGQIGGVRVLARLSPLIAGLADRAQGAVEDDLGGCALASDIASMRHETQTTRLFLT